MFIDIHVHLRKNPIIFKNGKQHYASPEELLERYDKLGIEKSCNTSGWVFRVSDTKNRVKKRFLENLQTIS